MGLMWSRKRERLSTNKKKALASSKRKRKSRKKNISRSIIRQNTRHKTNTSFLLFFFSPVVYVPRLSLALLMSPAVLFPLKKRACVHFVNYIPLFCFKRNGNRSVNNATVTCQERSHDSPTALMSARWHFDPRLIRIFLVLTTLKSPNNNNINTKENDRLFSTFLD